LREKKFPEFQSYQHYGLSLNQQQLIGNTKSLNTTLELNVKPYVEVSLL